jgi:hypothetical protein
VGKLILILEYIFATHRPVYILDSRGLFILPLPFSFTCP